MLFSHSRSKGLTLVELLAGMAIMVILATLVTTVVSRLPGAADRSKCSANLRNLHIALDTYLQEQTKWPQQPDFDITQQTEYENWWMKTMAPYGMTPGTWQCPAVLRLGKLQAHRQSPLIHYTPTMFDANPSTPRKWNTQPWAVEIANVHGRGALLLFPDGSIRDLDDVLAEAQKN